MISIKQKGDFRKITSFVEEAKNIFHLGLLDKYGERGVEALAEATPKRTGKTAASWYYEIDHSGERVTISFKNSNIQNGYPIAIILLYGHGTKNGKWVEGRDYISPAIQPVFDEILEEAWKEVTSK